MLVKVKKSQKRAFNIQKATNIASAAIDTYMSAQSAYKSTVGIPVVGPVLAPLAAAGAIAAGLINIKKIKATQFEGGAVQAVAIRAEVAGIRAEVAHPKRPNLT